MKTQVCLALIILAVLPVSAQRAASPNGSGNGDAAIALAQDYAARVDGLLREVHTSLRNISESLEAGRLTPEQAGELKLVATRDMIARLDAISAVYEARLDAKAKADAKTGSVASNASAEEESTHATVNSTLTVSVEELKREAAAPVVTSRGDEGTR